MEIALKSLNRCQCTSTDRWVRHIGTSEEQDGIEIR